MTDYQPTQDDINWASQTVALLNDHGTWIYPAAKMIFQINKTNKTLTLVIGPTSDWHTEQFQRTIKVFAIIGYTVRNSADNYRPGMN